VFSHGDWASAHVGVGDQIMCLPVAALALAAGGISAVSGAVGTIGKIQQDNAQAQVADANANAEKQAAQQDQTSMNQAALTRYMQVGQTEGNQRAAQAANGVTVDYGSSGAQVQSTAVEGDMDVSKAYQQGYQQQRAHDVAIANDQATASAARSNAVMSGISGALSFAGGLTGGVSSAEKTAYEMSGGTNTSVLGGVTQFPKLKAMLAGSFGSGGGLNPGGGGF